MHQKLQDFLLRQASPTTQRTYSFIIKRFLKHFNDTPPQSNSWVNDYITHLKNKGLNNQTVNLQLVVIKGFYKFAFNHSLVYDRLKQNQKEIEFLTPEEELKLRSASNSAFSAVLSFMLDTGARVHEVTAISRQIFDFVPREFIVLGKGHEQRMLIISESTQILLQGMFKNGLVFGRTWSIRSIQYALTQASGKVGIKHVHPHMLRHTFSTRMLWKGVDIQDIQKVLGHKHLSTTQIYTHVTPDRIRKVWQDYHNVRNKQDNSVNSQVPV